MADKCPKCGETLITRTIQKKMGLGSIDFPVAEICPKCNWNRDLTGAGDIVAKPPVPEETGTSKEKKPVISGQAQGKQEKVLEVTRPVPEKSKQMSEKSRPAPERAKPGMKTTRSDDAVSHKRVIDTNKIVTMALILLVMAAIISAFTSKAPEQTSIVKPTSPEPIVTSSATPSPTVIPQVTYTGNNITVKIDRDRGFVNSSQQNLKIKLGDGIVWKNDGSYSLTLVSSEGLFMNKLLDNDKITTYIFKKTGTYNFDIIVKGVKKFNGTVVVEP